MKIKRFKNGNFSVRIEESDNKYPHYLERNDFELIIDLCDSIELDFCIAGDEQCVSNYDMCYPLYNANTDMMYYPTGSDVADYANGKAVRLCGRKLTSDDIEELTKLELRGEYND